MNIEWFNWSVPREWEEKARLLSWAGLTIAGHDIENQSHRKTVGCLHFIGKTYIYLGAPHIPKDCFKKLGTLRVGR